MRRRRARVRQGVAMDTILAWMLGAWAAACIFAVARKYFVIRWRDEFPSNDEGHARTRGQ